MDAHGPFLYDRIGASWANRQDKFFLEEGNEEGTAAKKYNEQLAGIVTKTEERREMLKLHCREDHFNAYGIRKGSATEATSGTTQSPNLPSIAHRGDWSMGAVFDIYWQFLPIGDHYLGRVLAGLCPNKPSFKTLPPHWNIPNPMRHPAIKEAMEANYGPILARHQGEEYDPTGLLLRCLACVVHHSEAIEQAIEGNLGHPLMATHLFGPQSNLQALRQLVTLEPTPGVMVKPTGIPPSVEMACQLEEIKNSLNQLVQWTVDFTEQQRQRDIEQATRVVEAVRKGIDENDIQSGNVSGSRLAEMLAEDRKQAREELTTQLQGVVATIAGMTNHNNAPAPQPPAHNHATEQIGGLSTSPQGTLFHYDGKYWGVPKNFAFPKPVSLEKALRLWLIGSKVSNTANVRPYRMLRWNKTRGHLFPEGENRTKFSGHWAQFFNFLENAGLLDGMPNDTSTMSPDQQARTIEKMWAILEERVSYCFKKSKRPQKAISTWAKAISVSKIQEFGTESDKAYLGGKQAQKRKHATRIRKPQENVMYVKRQKKRRGHQSGLVTTNFFRPGLSGIQERITATERDNAATTGTTAPTESFAPQDADTNATHVQWLIDNFGNKFKGQQPVQVQTDGFGRRGRCAVVGCKYPTLVLEGRSAHRCHRCGIPVHNICVGDHHLRDGDDNNYCSEPCLNRRLNPPQFAATL